jgi:hypothetical protein
MVSSIAPDFCTALFSTLGWCKIFESGSRPPPAEMQVFYKRTEAKKNVF